MELILVRKELKIIFVVLDVGRIYHYFICYGSVLGHDVWKADNFSCPSISFGSFRDVLDCVWASHGQASIEQIFVVFCWNVRKPRNEVNFEYFLIPPSLCVGRAIDWLGEYYSILSLDQSPRCVDRAHVKWVKHPLGVIKVNFDGCFSSQKEGHGIGFVARSRDGSTAAVGATSVWSCPSVEDVEACALLWAMKYSLEQGWSDV